ncbi:MAG: hypothetical protein WC716_04350 [Chitinophagaceae bacterium]|jgi:hypothetical protein
MDNETYDLLKEENLLQFENEVQVIFESHLFFAQSDTNYEELDASTSERYGLLKDASAKYFFAQEKLKLRDELLIGDAKTLISGKIQELQKIVLNRKLAVPIERKKIYISAIHYLNSLYNGEDTSRFKEEEIFLMLHLLHSDNYFEQFHLPDLAIISIDDNNIFNLIAKAYGKYTLFYNFLLEEAAIFSLKTQTNFKNIPHRENKKERKTKNLIQIWQGSEQQYLEAISFLKQPFVEGENDVPFITEDKNGNYIWLSYHIGYQQYLAAFLTTCMLKNLIPSDFSGDDLVAISFNTFSLKALDKPSFTYLPFRAPNKKYMDAFSTLFK